MHRDSRKVAPLLAHLEEQQKPFNYYALDLSHASLVDSLQRLTSKHRHVSCYGLWGNFDDVLAWCKSLPSPRIFLSLGSTFGNDRWEDALAGLRLWADELRADDKLLIGIDGNGDKDKVWRSYHDDKGLIERFLRNGFEHTNRILGKLWYRDDDWTVAGVLEEGNGGAVTHRFLFTAVRPVDCPEIGLSFQVGDEIDCYEAFKYRPDTMRAQFKEVGLQELAFWKAPKPEAKICESSNPATSLLRLSQILRMRADPSPL